MITAEYMRTGTDGSTTVPAEGTGQGDHRQHRTQTYQKQLYPVTTSADVAWRSSATLPPDKGSVIFRHETSSCPPGSLTHDVNNPQNANSAAMSPSTESLTFNTSSLPWMNFHQTQGTCDQGLSVNGFRLFSAGHG